MTEPAPAPTTPAEQSASDTALFAKYTEQHHADASNDAPSTPAAGRGSVPAVAGRGAPAATAESRRAGADAGGDGAARDAGGSAADDASASASERQRAAGEADDATAEAPETEAAAPAALSEADAVALLRSARESGNVDDLDRALKVLLPGSKGLSEFNVDGKRYGELRAVTNKERKKIAAERAELVTRETNVKRGLQIVEQLVERYQPFEQLVQALDKDDAEGFAEQFQKVTKKSLNDILRRDLDKKLGKKTDPEVEALKQELKAEREAREKRERDEAAAREHHARAQQIEGHLVFLRETLGKDSDARVSALVNTDDGLREIFLEQKNAYDARTQTTITPAAAAKRVLDRVSKKLEPWQKVLGAAPRALPAAATPAATPAAPATPRATPLGSRGAAAASGSGARALSDVELFEKYERLAKLAGE